MNKQIVGISKFLSFVLRHKPQAIGITLDAEGWVVVEELLAAAARHGHSITREQVEEVVATNDKKRFSFSPDGQLIRANQGHSVEVDLGLVPVEPPESALSRHRRSVSGLDPRARTSARQPPSRSLIGGPRNGGSRGPAPWPARGAGGRGGRMHCDGHEFYRSENGVWLTETVPAEYLQFPDDRVANDSKRQT